MTPSHMLFVRFAVSAALGVALPMTALGAHGDKEQAAITAQETEIQAVRDQVQALVDRLNKLEAANAQLKQSNETLAQENAQLKAQDDKIQRLEKAVSADDKARDAQTDSIAKVAAKVASVAAGNGVELYGVLDAGIATIQHSLAPSTTFSSTFQAFDPVPTTIANGTSGQTAVMNGGLQDSRWGIRGDRDIGSGLRVTFALESGINLPTGTLNSQAAAVAAQTGDKTTSGSTTTTLSHAASVAANSALNGQLFGRQAWIGLGKDGVGTLEIGRTLNPLFEMFAAYDPVMKADGFSPFGISGTVGGGGGVSEDTRIDNSVKYIGKFGDVNLSAVYAVGGAGGISDANTGYVLNAGYDNGTFGAQVVFSSFRNEIKESNTTWSVTSPYYLKGTLYDSNDLTIALKAKVTDALTLKGGYQHYTLEKASHQLTSTSVVDGMLYGIPTTFASYADGDQKVDVYFVGGDYKVTSRLLFAAGYYDFSYDAWQTAAGLAVPSGGIKNEVALVDYTLGKNTDWYVAYMHADFSGQKGSSAISTSSGAAAPNFSTNSILGSGLRFKF